MRKTDRIGETNINLYGSKMTIINYNNANNIDIQFENGYIVQNRRYTHFLSGSIKSPYDKSVYNIGYLGIGKYKDRINSIISDEYKTWSNIFMRCYNEKELEKHPTYKDCIICDEWLNFQVFAEWFNQNYYKIDGEQMTLDKDILYKGNKVYSPENCIFVPQGINKLFTKSDKVRGKYPIGVTYHKGVGKFVSACNDGNKKTIHLGYYNTPEDAFYKGYKPYKEKIIKQKADDYKNKIPINLYNALYKYEVEITD